MPTKILYYDPHELKLKYKNINFKSLDNTNLHAWYFPSKKESKGVVLQFHGNAENISSHYLSLIFLIDEGYDLFVFDYRGYGLSSGRANRDGIYLDSLAAIKFVFENYIKNKDKAFILWGQSLGGIILGKALIDIENEILEKISYAIFDSTFSSYRKIAKEKLGLSFITWPLKPLVYLLVSEKHAIKGKISLISHLPILVIHGDRDEIVPLHHGLNIYNEAKEPKKFLQIKNGKHIDGMHIENGKYRKFILEEFNSITTK